jgi:hypothetical protein
VLHATDSSSSKGRRAVHGILVNSGVLQLECCTVSGGGSVCGVMVCGAGTTLLLALLAQKVQILTLRTRAHVQQAFRWSGASWRISAAAVCVSRGQGRAAAFLFYSWFFFFYTCCCAAGVCVTGKGELLLLRSTIAGVVA